MGHFKTKWPFLFLKNLYHKGMLTPEKIQHYKSRLETEKARLFAEIKRNETPENFGSDTEDNSEEANEAEEFGNQLAANQALKERVSEIDSALNKIEIGKYGVCETCGGMISEKILEIVPESRLCENCKKKK